MRRKQQSQREPIGSNSKKRRDSLCLSPSHPPTGESVKPIPPEEEPGKTGTPTVEKPMREERTDAVFCPGETKFRIEVQPAEEKRMAALARSKFSCSVARGAISAEARPAEEKRMAALPVPSSPAPSQEDISAKARPAEEKQIVALPVAPATSRGKGKTQEGSFT